MEEIKCKLKLVEESDIEILYVHLKEFLSEQDVSITESEMPKFEDSKKFVLKYLHDNENHEYDKWYLVLDEKNNIIGNVDITKKNWIAYHILKQFQGKGYGYESIKLLMENNPRPRYFATIHQKNNRSINLIEKFGFHKKAQIFEKVVDT